MSVTGKSFLPFMVVSVRLIFLNAERILHKNVTKTHRFALPLLTPCQRKKKTFHYSASHAELSTLCMNTNLFRASQLE